MTRCQRSRLVAVGLGVALAACGTTARSVGTTVSTPSTSSTVSDPTSAELASAAAPPTTVAEPASKEPSTTATPPTVAGPAEPDPIVISVTGHVATWTATYSLHGSPEIWTTTFVPNPAVPRIIVSAAEFDQNRLTAVLFGGPDSPGGTHWRNFLRVPPAAVPALVAAFNGGFKLKDIAGGYWTEGRAAKALAYGQATLAIDHAGRMRLGVYSEGMTNDGQWVSMLQNGPPVVRNGEIGTEGLPEITFGDDANRQFVTFRSAICLRRSGRMMYVAMSAVRVHEFAIQLVHMGCTLAMQLDITGHRPQFAWYDGLGTMDRTANLLHAAMQTPNRYLQHSIMNFVALFDPATLPPGAVA